MRILKHILEKAVNVVAVVLFIVVFVTVLLQIFSRYVLNNPLIWTEELCRYTFIWIAMLGWVMGTRQNSHLGVNVVLHALPQRVHILAQLFIKFLTLVFMVVLGYYGAVIAGKTMGKQTYTLFFTYGLVYAIVPVTAILIGLYTIADALELVKRWKGRQQEVTQS
ncbi:hypothetical protein CSB45_08090 [candidate division KSB3 bacterium]|uniref:Tripartite ATP-independent periplasmic transporters DctQ component domain-containing protein n=1 Tax=candidate division KSB3 bacterium TaxID=2044937 RepID=A0A2G6E523_9BACT|nr:MAG: hypothetical protein CSB45_08090 [candidate division KSB3 bacterium]PIE29820.1 MAG: hypothetical protein CSA57_07125 [candidate division KSB3 bacterium]